MANISKEEIERRKFLWIALSGLFLDTGLQYEDCKYIACTIKRSGYTLEQAENILKYEVLPVCYANLLSTAGAWSSFDEDWLIKKINDAGSHGIIKRFLYNRKFKVIEKEWLKISVIYKEYEKNKED